MNRHLFKLKVSKNATFDEVQDALRKMTGNSEFVLDQDAYKNFIELNQAGEVRQKGLMKIVGNFYEEYKDKSDRESIKKRYEITHLINYIYDSGRDIKLLSVGESPDFIVEYGDEHYGIEHTGIFDSTIVAEINIIEGILEETLEILKEKNTDLRLLINVTVDPEKIELKDRKKLPEIISEYLQAIIDEKVIPPLSFVTNVILSPQDELQIVLSEEYRLKDLSIESIEKTITEKENKIEKYKENCGLNKIWLLVVLEGASAKSNLSIDLENLPKRNTPFSKIIIYNFFKNEIIETLH